jgi:hypothetical protein
LIQELQRSQAKAWVMANKKRNEAPSFLIGDKVWLLRRNIATT